MDFVIEMLKFSMPFLLLSIVIVAILKAYLIAQVKRFDVAETFFSFFRLYNYDERSMSSNRKRIAYMQWNNLLNYYVYAVFGTCILVYFVTKNA